MLPHRTSSSSLRERAEHVVAAKVDAFDHAERLELIKQLLVADEVDIKALGRLAVAGIPADQKVRAVAWQLLLGYLPPKRSDWESTLQQRHTEYESFCTDFMINPQRAEQSKDDEPLSDAEGSAWAEYFKDVEEHDQIQRDLERTHQTVPFFNTDVPSSLPHHAALQRLLFVFSKLNSGLKYVQGMNELVAPLYMVFSTDAASEEAAKGAEADTFFCFIRVLTVSETRDLYCKTLDTAASGVASVMAEFLQRLSEADPTVGAHLVAQKVDPHYFAFRWMTVLFSQDIENLPDVLRVWDFLFGDPQGCKEAVMRFCCALLLGDSFNIVRLWLQRQRTQLLATEFPEIIKVLQSCGRTGFDAEDTIQIASSLSSMYIPSM